MDQYNNNDYQQYNDYQQAPVFQEDIYGNGPVAEVPEVNEAVGSAFSFGLAAFIVSLAGCACLPSIVSIILAIISNSKLKKAKELAESYGVELSGKAKTAKTFSIIALVVSGIVLGVSLLSLVAYLIYGIVVGGLIIADSL